MSEHLPDLPQDEPLIYMKDIRRQFGTIVALDGVDFKVWGGKVIGLLGDNGAGKSTLIKVLMGVYTPTSGQIYWEGQPVRINSPQEAQNLGIEAVYQDLALIPLMSIARNFYLGREPVRRQIGPIKILDQEAMERQAEEALLEIGIHIRSPKHPVGSLSGGERQSVAIGRAVYFGKRVLILDEPTSALSIGETRKVLNYTTAAAERGMGVIFITHNIFHVFEVADIFTVIYHGRKVGDFPKEMVDQETVAEMIMTGQVPRRLEKYAADGASIIDD